MKSTIIYLLPLLLFVLLFIASGVIMNDFYAVTSVFWIVVVSILSFIYFKGSFEEKFDTFLKGVSDKNILLMCVIFLLSGAFTSLSKSTGAIDYLTYLILNYIDASFLFVGVFLLSCVLSFALGTSVGTIVALGPIVYQIAENNHPAMVILGGALLGGAMFGDNLSFISDTTIAATQTMHVKMKDKFKANAVLASTAAVFTFLVLSFSSVEFTNEFAKPENTSLLSLVPYVLIIVLALLGLHVVKVLVISCFTAFSLLIFSGFDFVKSVQSFYTGMNDMFEICILSLCIGGLVQMIDTAGGIQYIITKLQQLISDKVQRVPLVIASLVSLVNACVANNTIALLISGPIANNISDTYKLDKPKMASVLDIFSCIVQCLLPYGAQVLILLSLFQKKIDYVELVQYSYYIWFLLVVTLVSMFISFRKQRAN